MNKYGCRPGEKAFDGGLCIVITNHLEKRISMVSDQEKQLSFRKRNVATTTIVVGSVSVDW